MSTPLPFSLSVLVRQHSNGTVTARVLGLDDLVAWGPDPDAVREDLELAASDRLERSHPSLLHRFHAPRGRRADQVEVPELLPIHGAGEDGGVQQRDAPLDVVVEPEGDWLNVWIPRLDARVWVAAPDTEDDDGDRAEAIERAVVDLVKRSVGAVDSHTRSAKRLSLRPEDGMVLQSLDLEVQIARLEAFTGEHAGKMLLPEPQPDPEEDDPAAIPTKDGKKPPPTPMLDRLAIDLGADPEALVRAHGRDAEVADLLRMLDRPGAVVCVVGPPTCGKSAVIDQVARVIGERADAARAAMRDGRPGDVSDGPLRAWFCDASRLVNAGVFSDWRSQTLDVVTELAATGGIWATGDPIALLDAGKHVSSEMNVAQLLKPYLSNGQLRVLAECSEQTWGRMVARDAGFARLFTPYRLTEPDPDDVRGVLDAVASDLPVPVGSEGLDAAMGLSRRYGSADALLGTTCHFLRRLTSEARARGLEGPLGRLDVIQRFCAETGLPQILVRDEVHLDPEAVRAAFADRLVGQDDALTQMVDLIAVIKGGMSDLERPLGSFLFVGPTGVGKTETAKALASWLFGSDERLVRFDMSEYGGPDCLQRLLDPEAGLVARVQRNPFCVVLLDEVEKAHHAVFDLLLQVLGEARLSDAEGRTADFRNAVVLMTSNLGVGSFRRPTGFGADLATALSQHVLTEVERFFRPELFNRIDRIIPFASLGSEAITGIARRELDKVVQREGLKGRGVELEVSDDVVAWLAERGVDVQYGARPLKRAITTELTAPLARHLSGSGVPPRVHVRVGDGRLDFDNAEASEGASKTHRLSSVVEHLSELRFRARCWEETSLVRAARHEVRMVHRLLASKRFWRDEKAARNRLELLQPKVEALRTLDTVQEQIRAAEELAHEAWAQRASPSGDGSMIDGIAETMDEARHDLVEAALTVADIAFDLPDKATLRFSGQVDWRPELIMLYADLAIQRGWSIAFRPSKGLEWPGGGRKGDGKLSADAFLHKVRRRGDATAISMLVEGPHCAAILAGETGTTVRKVPNDPQHVRVEFAPGGWSALPDAVPELLPTRRVFDLKRKQLKDTHTGRTTTLVAREARSVSEMARLALFVRLHGADRGQRLWKATDAADWGPSWS